MTAQNRRGTRSLGVLGLTAVAFVAGCSGQSAPPPPPPQTSGPNLPPPTKAPADVPNAFTGKIDDATRTQILAYAHALQFNASPGASDVQQLQVDSPPGKLHPGPRVRIEPEVGAVGLTRKELGEGRIVAVMVNYSNRAYPKLAIPPRGKAYFWMDSTATGKWRAIYIPDDPHRPLRTRVTATRIVTVPGGATDTLRDSVIVHVNTDSIFRSRAKWLWSKADEGTWTSCTMNGCCYSNSDFTGS